MIYYILYYLDNMDIAPAVVGIDERFTEILTGGDRKLLLEKTVNAVNKAVGMDVNKITPPPENIFNAFKLCTYAKLAVCIVGQDPYPKKGNAMGLSFSSPRGTVIPSSLKNIYKCLDAT